MFFSWAHRYPRSIEILLERNTGDVMDTGLAPGVFAVTSLSEVPANLRRVRDSASF